MYSLQVVVVRGARTQKVKVSTLRSLLLLLLLLPLLHLIATPPRSTQVALQPRLPMDTSKPTRLILSNLPPSLTTPLLRTHLNKCPPAPPSLTDLKIVLKPDGTSRRIAFAGFRDSAEADRVRTWVAGTWVQGSAGGARVRVDWAKDVRTLSPSLSGCSFLFDHADLLCSFVGARHRLKTRHHQRSASSCRRLRRPVSPALGSALMLLPLKGRTIDSQNSCPSWRHGGTVL